jgi:hypothetical protein
MVLGGNLIGGWAHARDLIYVDKLVKAYHTDWGCSARSTWPSSAA